MDGYYNTFWPGRQTLNAIFVDKYERARRGTVLGVLSGVRGKGTGSLPVERALPARYPCKAILSLYYDVNDKLTARRL